MDINSLLKVSKCPCGRDHACNIEAVFVESGAISRLSTLCRENKSILIVADENTYKAAGDKVECTLGDKSISRVIFSGETVLIPNEYAIERVMGGIDDADLILGIGSGVIQDLCKYISHVTKIPYIIVATAPSMDGYASSGAAMILNGMKETVAAGVPKAIVADIDIIKNAPLDMIKAGYGDIVGKFSALADWRLAAFVRGEYLCEYIYKTTSDMIDATLSSAEGLLHGDEQSIKLLTEALMAVGVMMSFAGSSRPASGSEHHLSHFFEIMGIISGEEYFAHGIDVAYSTVITSMIREKISKSEIPSVAYRPTSEEYTEAMQKIYGPVADGCIALQDRVGLYSEDRLQKYKEKEREIGVLFSSLPSSDEIVSMLKAVEIDMADFYKLYGEEKIQNAIAYAKDLKDRYSVLWMNYDLFAGKL